MTAWTTRKLRDIADIRVSNVDKKTHASEKPVKLCNYMDVYTNEYVTGVIQFMEASASIAEIERFGLRFGDVIITKDSETPDDIGIPTVIAEEVKGLVCGYHLALIRPNADIVDPTYLAKQLSTSRVARYFSLHASGSTRYGLPISAIESVEIPTPPKPEQTKIAEILSTVDRAIEQTEALIAKQQRIKTGLMQDLLTRGIDEHSNLRSEQTHKFKDSPLGRIPVEWDAITIGDRANVKRGASPRPIQDPKWWGGQIGWVRISDVTAARKYLLHTTQQLSKQGVQHSILIQPGDVILSICATIGRPIMTTSPVCIHDGFVWFDGLNESIDREWFYYYLLSKEEALANSRQTGTQGNLNTEIVSHTDLLLPRSMQEQKRIVKTLATIDRQIDQSASHLWKLRSLKTALIQDLLTGKKRVTTLLNDTEGT